MKVSVIIPAYNEEKNIRQTIQALKHQQFDKKDYEILVVDNDSTDQTATIAKEEQVRILQYTKNHIVAAIRNYGAAQANGEIVAFMDADSVADVHWLSSLYTYLQKEDIVAATGVALPQDGTIILPILFALYNQFLRLNQLIGIVLPWGFNLAIKKTFFDDIGGFNEKLTSYEDAEIGLRIQENFGKKSIIYTQQMKVYTSTRKHQSFYTLLVYIFDTIKNYLHIVILKKHNVTNIRYIR